MYGKIATGGSASGAGAITVLPDSGGFLPLGAMSHGILIFLAVFTLIAAGLALWNILPRRER